jgi:uncharacterized membrane protein
VLGDIMQDKVEFVKWLFKNINYFYVALFFHLVICFSFAFVPNPYDKVIGIYILMSITISMLYMCVLLPLKMSYEKFKREKKKESELIDVPLTYAMKDRYKL